MGHRKNGCHPCFQASIYNYYLLSSLCRHRVDMPAEMAPYLRQFGVFVSTKRMQVCLCSYGDRLTMGFSAPFVDTSVQRHFFRQLTEMGIDVELTANVQEGGEAHADL